MKKFYAFIAVILLTTFVISSCIDTSSESAVNSSTVSKSTASAQSSSTTSTISAANSDASDIMNESSESVDTSSALETSKPDESDIDGFINWYFDTFTSNEDNLDLYVLDYVNKTSDDFAKIVNFGEDAFKLLDDIIINLKEYDLVSYQRHALALYIKYSIKPELYEHMYYSPDKKSALKESPKWFGRFTPFEDDIKYKFELIDCTTQKVKLTADDAFGLVEIEWSPNSQYVAISHGEMRRFYMTDAIDVKEAKFIELPKQKELIEILNEKYPNKYYVGGSFSFEFEEWVDENKIKISFILCSDSVMPDCEGWYIYDFTKTEIVDIEAQKIISDTQTFTFKVKDSMPEYKCVANIGMNDVVFEIIITEKDSGKVIQTINPKVNYSYMNSALYFMDVTFDGAVDLLVPFTSNSKRLFIYAYRWDEAKKQFIYQESFEELGNVKIDSTNKKIMTHNSIWLRSGVFAEFYSILSFNGQKYVVEKQFSITPSEDKTKAVFKETSGDIGSETVIAEFELPLDQNGGFDKTDKKIKPYYISGSAWDLDSDKWQSPFKKEIK